MFWFHWIMVTLYQRQQLLGQGWDGLRACLWGRILEYNNNLQQFLQDKFKIIECQIFTQAFSTISTCSIHANNKCQTYNLRWIQSHVNFFNLESSFKTSEFIIQLKISTSSSCLSSTIYEGCVELRASWP